MNATAKSADKVRREIALSLVGLGLIKSTEYRDLVGVKCAVYKKSFANGDLCVSIGAATSNSGNLFVRFGLGLDCPVLQRALNEIVPGLSDELRLPYALLGWAISDTLGSGFEPSPEHPGASFFMSNPVKESELELLRGRIPRWVATVESYLEKVPLYEFYRDENRIDRSDGRWREIFAILKLISGERYVGHQLLVDLWAEGCGKRPEFGEWHPEWTRTKPPKPEEEFQNQLLRALRRADGDLVYGRVSKLAQVRKDLEWGLTCANWQ